MAEKTDNNNNALRIFPEDSWEAERLLELTDYLDEQMGNIRTGKDSFQVTTIHYTLGHICFNLGFEIDGEPMQIDTKSGQGWTTIMGHDPKEPIDSPSESWLVLTPDEQRIAVYGNLQDQRKLRDTIRKRKRTQRLKAAMGIARCCFFFKNSL